MQSRKVYSKGIILVWVVLSPLVSAEDLSSSEISKFLLHPVPHYSGAESFFDALRSNEAARNDVNQKAEENSSLKATARKGARFKELFLSELKKDFPDSQKGVTQDLALDPMGTIKKSLDAFRQMNRQDVELPLRPEQVNSRALQETISMYRLPEGTSEGDLKPGTAEAQFFNQKRWRLSEETERRRSRGDDAEILNQWKRMISTQLEDTRAANLKELGRVVARTTGGVRFGDSPSFSEGDLQDLHFEILSTKEDAKAVGSVKPPTIASKVGSWTLRYFKEALVLGDKNMHRLFGFPQFKEAMRTSKKSVELPDASRSTLKIESRDALGNTKVLYVGSVNDFVKGLERKYAERKKTVSISRATGKMDLFDRLVEESIHREKSLGILQSEIIKNPTEKTDYFVSRFKKVEANSELLSPTQKALAHILQAETGDLVSNLEWYGHGMGDKYWQVRDASAKSKEVFHPESGASKPAPARLVRRGFKAVPSLVRAGVLWSAMTSGMGAGAAATIYFIQPDSLRMPDLPFDVSQWLPEREVKETPPVLDLDAKNGAKAKSTVLFEVSPLKGQKLEDLPMFFHYATKEQLVGARKTTTNDSGIDVPAHTGKGDLKVTSNIPMKATDEHNEITIPSPKDGKLTGLVIRDKTGKKLTPNTTENGKIKQGDYFVRQDPASGVYFAKLSGSLTTSIEDAKAASYKIEASFEQPKDESEEKDKNNEPMENKSSEMDSMKSMTGGGFMKDAQKRPSDERVDKIPAAKVRREVELLKKAGLTEIAKHIEEKIEGKESLVMEELGLAVMKKSVQSEKRGIPSDKPVDPTDPYAEFKQYVKQGKMHADANTGNRLLERMLKRIYADKPDVAIYRIPVIIRDPAKSELNVKNFFVRNVVSVDGGKKTWVVDGVPSEKPEPEKPKDLGKPIVDLDRPRKKASIQAERELKKTEIDETAHKARLQGLKSQIDELYEVLKGDPASRRTKNEGKQMAPKRLPPKVPGHIAAQLKSAKVVTAVRALSDYAEGKGTVEELFSRLHELFPRDVKDPKEERKIEEVDYEAPVLERSYEESIAKSLSGIKKSVMEEIRGLGNAALRDRKSGPMAIHASPDYQKAVENILDYAIKTDWSPFTKGAVADPIISPCNKELEKLATF